MDEEQIRKYINQNNKSLSIQKLIQIYTILINRNWSNAEYYLLRGINYYKAKDYSKALDDFDNSIEKNSSTAAAHTWKVIIFQNKQDTDKALEELKRAYCLNRENLEDVNAFASYYINNHDFYEAIAWLEKSIAIDSNNYEVYKSLLLCLAIEKMSTRVLDLIEKCKPEWKNRAAIHFVTALALVNQKNTKEAFEEIRKAVNSEPDNNIYQRFYGAISAADGVFNLNFNFSDI